ncbi:hypothetical protein Tco_0692932 [Tanacetum coccineum]
MEVGTTTNNNLTARLPLLNPGDYDLWLMRIEQYFLMTDYSLWEVIKNGNKVLKKMVGTVEQEYEPTSVEEKQERRNEMKARATLLMALPNKDQLKFHTYQDAKLLMEAIEKRYGGNKESKKVQRTLLKQQYENFAALSSESIDQTFDRLQKLIGQLEIQGEVINQEDMNLKLLRSLPSEWKYHALIWRNKAEIETISLDDLYNNLKIYEPELTGSSSTSQNTQNVAFVSNSTNNTNSTHKADDSSHEISTTQSTTHTHHNGSNTVCLDNLCDAVICAFLASQPNCPQLSQEDLEQLHPDDLEEMDLQWEMAMLTIRARRFIKRTRKKLNINGQRVGFDKSNGMLQLGDSYSGRMPLISKRIEDCDWSYKAEEDNQQIIALMRVEQLMLLLCYTYNVKTVTDKEFFNTVESNAVRMDNTSAPIIEDWNSDDESEIDYTIVPSIEKTKSVKTVRETDAAKQNSRGNQRNWNNLMSQRPGNDFKMTNKAVIPLQSRILNMVPTKKVDRKPYEIWHGKAPMLSYLRVWGCYPKETMGCYFYYPLKNKIFVSRNVEFFENSFMVQEASGSHELLEISGSDKGLEIIQEEDSQPSENTSKEHDEVAPIKVEPQNVRVPIRRSAKIPQAPDRYGYYVDVEEYELGDFDEPPNYIAALAHPESDKWLEAMNTEMQSMKDNQVWILVELPPNGQTVGSKWLFKKKTNMDGNLHTFKAHLVAKGYTQTYEQASRSWNKSFDKEIKKIGFTQNPDEPCVYLKASGSNVAFLILLRRSSIYSWNQDHTCRSKRLIALSQSAYLEKILKKFRMENSKKGYTSMMEKPDYRKSQGAKTPTEVQCMLRVPYASAIGSIMYTVRCTRPDVAFAQNLCSRFQQNPGEIHWTAMKTILKYLRYTKDMVLVYRAKPEDELKVSCFADASFQTDKDDTKSQMGYVFVLNAEASMEAVWMRKFIDGLGGVMPTNKRFIKMLCDNEPALAIVGDLRILKGARHFQRKYHYIREVIQEG